MPLPLEDQKWLKTWCQVFKPDRSNKWMRRAALKKAVIAGKTAGWTVVHIDPETGLPSIICPYCATDVEHRGSFH